VSALDERHHVLRAAGRGSKIHLPPRTPPPQRPKHAAHALIVDAAIIAIRPSQRVIRDSSLVCRDGCPGFARALVWLACPRLARVPSFGSRPRFRSLRDSQVVIARLGRANADKPPFWITETMEWVT
jgi:hypothetical protein